jgi:hypothetical protein
MYNNLFVNVPLKAPFDFLSYPGGLWILAHIITGLLILSFGLAIGWFSFKSKDFLILKLSALAILFTAIAIICGIVFLEIFSIPSLYNIDNYFSLTMAMSFLSVFTMIFADLYTSKKAKTS